MKALLLIDLQNDFMPGGALAVPRGDEVVEVANHAMDGFDLVVASRDWHPRDHLSFASQHAGKSPGDVIHLDGVQQTLWPDHCVQETHGAELHSGLQTGPIQHVVYKGADRRIDSYSAFFDNARKRSTGLDLYLRERGVTEVHLMGLATDYCVKFTALDAVDLGFRTHVHPEGCRGIDLHPGDIDAAWRAMGKAGVTIVAGEAKVLHEGRFLRLLDRDTWEFVERRNVREVAGIVAVTNTGEAVFVEQYRAPLQSLTIEWPAGLIGEGESVEDGANRELEEETGYRAKRLETLTRIPSSAGLTNETVLLLMAEDLERVSEGGGVDEEELTVHHVPLDRVQPWLEEREAEGKPIDPKIWAGLYFLHLRGQL